MSLHTFSGMGMTHIETLSFGYHWKILLSDIKGKVSERCTNTTSVVLIGAGACDCEEWPWGLEGGNGWVRRWKTDGEK